MSVPLRVLIVEDAGDDARLIVRELTREGHAVTFERVETADAMRAALRRGGWDAVISDFSLPSFDAPAALEVLQASGLDLPFIIVSGTVGEETAVAAMRAGAHDYMTKGRLARLAPALACEMREAGGRRERRQAEAALRLSEERLAVTLRSIGDGVIATDTEGRITLMNAVAEALTGWSQAAAAGRESPLAAPPGVLAPAITLLRQLTAVKTQRGTQASRPRGHVNLVARGQNRIDRGGGADRASSKQIDKDNCSLSPFGD